MFRNVEQSRVQAVAFELTEKFSILSESNGRATEARLGSGRLDCAAGGRCQNLSYYKRFKEVDAIKTGQILFTFPLFATIVFNKGL